MWNLIDLYLQFYNIQTVNTVVLCHIYFIYKLEKCVDSVEKIPKYN